MIVTMHTTAVQALRKEMMRRMNDDWHLDGDLAATEMWMLHLVMPPFWRAALELVNPVAWILGPTYPTIHRRMHVWVDEAGKLHRHTSGTIPPAWPPLHSWDVPDGPVNP